MPPLSTPGEAPTLPRRAVSDAPRATPSNGRPTEPEREGNRDLIDSARESPPKLRILIVDDDPLIRESVQMVFEGEPYSVLPCASADHALVAVARQMFDLAFVDLRLGEDSGMELIPQLLERAPWLKIVVVTADSSISSAVAAVRVGALEYLRKPLSAEELRQSAERVAELRALERRLESLEQDVDALSPTRYLDSKNADMKRVLATARKVADSHATVLLTGESGTGKGVLARAIHAWSPRSEGSFGVVSCPSLRSALLQSELFGHVRGAFTGAVSDKVGKIAATDGGTLFLDEVGDIPEEIQPQLLRFLQDREYERVGDPKTRTADVRVVAATNKDLAKAVDAGEFREDLYYRLRVIPVEIPPLRSRREDLSDLATLFMSFYSMRHGKQVTGFTDAALRTIYEYDWPGNVRELQNAIERAVILSGADRIGATLLPSGGSSALAPLGVMNEDLPTLEGMERRYIEHVLSVADSIERAAEILDVAPSTLWRRRRKFGI